MKTEEYSNAIIYLLMQNWKETKVQLNRDSSNDENVKSLISQIKENYELTGNNDDNILCSEIYAQFTDKKKINIELSNNNIHKKKCTKGENYNKWCFYGIRLK